MFIDIDHLRAGQKFKKILDARLSVSKVMLAIVGPKWLHARNDDGKRRLDDPSDWVRLEIVGALERGIIVIPILVDGAELPKESDLPSSLRPLVHSQAAVISTSTFRNDMAGLLKDIKQIRGSSSWGTIGVAVSIAATLVAAGWVSLFYFDFGSFSPTTSIAVKAPKLALEQRRDDGTDANVVRISEAVIQALAKVDAKRRTDESVRINKEKEARRIAEAEATRQSVIAAKAVSALEAAERLAREAKLKAQQAERARLSHENQRKLAEQEAKRQADLASRAVAKLAQTEREAEVVLAAQAKLAEEKARRAADEARQREDKAEKARVEEEVRQKEAEDEVKRQAEMLARAKQKQEKARRSAQEAKRKAELAAARREQEARFHEIDKAALIPDLARVVKVRGIAVSPDNALLAAAYDDGIVRVWGTQNFKLMHAFSTSTGIRANAVAFSPDGRQLAVASWDGAIWIWDVSNGALLAKFRKGSAKVYSVAFYSGASAYLASGHGNGSLRIWNLRTRKSASNVQGGAGPVYAVAYRPRSSQFVYTTGEGGIRYYKTRKSYRDLTPRHRGRVYSLAFAENGEFFVSGSYDKTVKVWDASLRSLRRELRGHSRYVLAVAISRNSSYIASGGGDKTIKIWNSKTGREIVTLVGHTNDVESLCFLRRGRYLVSSSEDKTLRVWDVQTRHQVVQIYAFSGGGGKDYLAARQDGKFYVTPGAESLVKAKFGDRTEAVSAGFKARRYSEGGISILQ